MESTHPFSVSFAPCFQAVLCRSQLFFRMFLDKLFQICADRFIMKQKRRCFSPFLLSPSSRRAWIEMYMQNYTAHATKSPSSRRAWIEITAVLICPAWAVVALLAEGVDRNISIPFDNFHVIVALLAEGVDRNSKMKYIISQLEASPSSRRAWIEIANAVHVGIQRYGRPPRGGRG